ncbi:hypothetical protein BGZ65_011835, partial [Modicella reniformis]
TASAHGGETRPREVYDKNGAHGNCDDDDDSEAPSEDAQQESEELITLVSNTREKVRGKHHHLFTEEASADKNGRKEIYVPVSSETSGQHREGAGVLVASTERKNGIMSQSSTAPS